MKPGDENRVAYSPSEFAAAFGKHKSWAYRLLYAGKIKAITSLGRILIPASEVERILNSAEPYDPQPKKWNRRKPSSKKSAKQP